MQIFAQRLAAVTFLTLSALAAVDAQSTADEPKSEIEVRGFYAIPSGEVSFSTTGSSGSVIDFERDFDFGNELGFELRYTFRSGSGKHKFLAEYTDTRWNRNATLSRDLTFLGQTYQANLDVESDLKLRTYRAMYSYRWGSEKFRFGPMVDAGVIDTKVNLTGTTNSGIRTGEGSITKFAATIGYDLDYRPNSKVAVFHNLGGIVFSGERLFHTEAGVKYFPVRFFGVSGGYKYRYYKTVEDDNFVRITTNGPFFGAIARF